VVFEGQGKFECDMLKAQVGDVVARKRPTSSSWSLAAAQEFVGKDAGPNGGVLLVHTVMPGVKAFVMGRLGLPHECEVLLQPGLELKVEVVTEFEGRRVLYTTVKA
jgi:hypothetical protein